MSEHAMIDAARDGDLDTLKQLVADGGDVHERDEQGWTPLCYAAGRGDAEAVKLLLAHGADVSLTGRDNRTPRMIARAAERQEVVEMLTAAEKEKGVWEDPRASRPYCRAYHLSELARFDGFSAAPADGDGTGDDSDDPVVYVHQDFTVTRSMWHGEDVVFDAVTPGWESYCRDELSFEIPADLL